MGENYGKRKVKDLPEDELDEIRIVERNLPNASYRNPVLKQDRKERDS